MFLDFVKKIKDLGVFYLVNILGLRFVRFLNLRSCKKYFLSIV